ncbi:kinase-like protein [Imleria badia]|nr:kinase-like protein [Imleria badia]
MFTIGTNLPLPPDLTPYIPKVDAQPVAGGGFGDVYRCWCHYPGDSRKEVAVKALRFRYAIDGDVSDKPAKMLHRELGIWRRLDHKNVVPFLGIAYGFGMRDAMSLVSLWMPNESLHHFLAGHDDNLELGQRLRFLLDIAHGLDYLHSFPIVHGDLNCNNVLLDVDYTARLTDFGYASLVGSIPEALAYLQRSTTRPGALRWIAPEQIDPEKMSTRTPQSDIYSFGCVALQESSMDTISTFVLTVLQVLSGKQPWSEVREDAAVVLRLAKGHKPDRPVSRLMDDVYWNWIQSCWSTIEERPATAVIIFTIQQFLSQVPTTGLTHATQAAIDTAANLEADPEARKVRVWRHRVQKAFFSSRGTPSDEDIPAMDQLFTRIERYEHPNLLNFIAFSKIGKVMRHIVALTPDKVPLDEQFKFRARARALIDKWHTLLDTNEPSENGLEITTNSADAAADTSEVRSESPG